MFECPNCNKDWLSEWLQTDIYLAEPIRFGFLIRFIIGHILFKDRKLCEIVWYMSLSDNK